MAKTAEIGSRSCQTQSSGLEHYKELLHWHPLKSGIKWQTVIDKKSAQAARLNRTKFV